jgi:uncharacterized membrane protein
MGIAITLHMLAAVIWVGGMFFAYMALRPAALELEAPQRLALWSRTFANFFPWVWGAVVVLPVTGYWMIAKAFGGFAQVGLYIHLMQAIGIVMILIFLHLYFAPYRRLRRAVVASDFASAGKQLAQIRVMVAVNLTLGMIVIVAAAAGAYWS